MRYFALLVGILLLVSCGKDVAIENYELVQLNIPKGFPNPKLPEDNPLTLAKIKLGKRLFFDPQLSGDNSLSCNSCHKQEHGFSTGIPINTGVGGVAGFRNAQPLMNMAWRTHFFRDGGVNRLELAPLNAIDSHEELNTSLPVILKKLNQDNSYRTSFKKAFDDSATAFTFLRALSAFQLTLISGNSRYDQFKFGNNSMALSENEQRGMALFFSERTQCSTCHSGVNFSSEQFESNGLFETYTDTGRQRITTHLEDRGKFSVPSLRNISVSAPYMHDGSIANLEAVIEKYDAGGTSFFNKSPKIQPLHLSSQEKADLISFLKALEDPSFLHNSAFKP